MSCLRTMLIKSQMYMHVSGWHCCHVFLVCNVQLAICEAQKGKQHLWPLCCTCVSCEVQPKSCMFN